MEITPLGLGSWAMSGLGWEHAWGVTDDSQSIATIRRAVELGVNWIDTAPVYGHGHSEEVVGRAVRELPEADRPYVFTKCGLDWSSQDAMAPARKTMSGLAAQVDASLTRLGAERIDLLQVHWPPDEPLEEYWQQMLDLRASGKIRAAGVSNFDVHQLAAAEKLGHVDSLQPPLSLLRPDAADDVIPWCAAHDTGVIVYSPLESGLLTDLLPEQLPPDDWRAADSEFAARREQARPILARLRPVAARHGVPVAAIAVAWTLTRPGVTGAIVGARRPEQIDGWLAAGELPLEEM
ncbi:aldo/keto reductase [Streptosporangiaceae bacterium NEAU-GS5]|nr:aldo/keto reductase [Streptosporangiaceae bacterium NEAU-GS5]